MTPALVIFDVDGTLVDSQAHIMARMDHAFRSCGLPAPDRQAVLSRVGMSLLPMMAELADEDSAQALCDGYRAAFEPVKRESDKTTLYPGTDAMLRALHATPHILLAVATGKSTRGLDRLIDEQGWGDLFVSRQTADDHPSKPHPSMIDRILRDSGVDRARTVMVGDTRFDIDMARNAGVASIAVPWGYNDPAGLNADAVLTGWDDLPGVLDHLWGRIR